MDDRGLFARLTKGGTSCSYHMWRKRYQIRSPLGCDIRGPREPNEALVVEQHIHKDTFRTGCTRWIYEMDLIKTKTGEMKFASLCLRLYKKAQKR